MMACTDPLIAKLQALRLALQDPDTWSLKPLVKLCQEAQEVLNQLQIRINAKEAE